MSILSRLRCPAPDRILHALLCGRFTFVYPLFFALQISAQPAIQVTGNANTIVNGDVTPSLLEYTDFGITSVATGSVSRTFTIANQGTGPLQFGGTPIIEIGGPDVADFTVTQQPSSSMINGGQSVTFTVTFNPTTAGVRVATVRIASNDPDDALYQFSVMGSGDFDIRGCADPCTGDDVVISNVELHDENGNPFPPVLCGVPGVTVISTLYITLSNNTSANRRAVRISCDVFVNGQDSGDDILSCFDGPVPGNSSVTFPAGTLIYTLGTNMELRNVKIAWRTAASANCSNSNTCNDYPGGQCSLIAPDHDFAVTTPLTTNFEMVPPPLCDSSLTASFMNTSTGGAQPFTYLWNFGDPASGADNTSTLPDPTHQFSASGDFTISLMVTDSNGAQCSITNQLLVIESAVAVASGGGTVTCAAPTLTLSGAGSDTGTNFSYQWTSANGHIVSGSNTLSPVVDQAGTYTLLVTNTLTGCTGSAAVNVGSDQIPPLASSGPPQMLNCTQSAVQLQGQGSVGPGITVQWTANPGSIVSGADTYTPMVDAPGLYTLVVTNSNNGCTNSSTVAVTENQAVPQANAGPSSMLNCLQTTYQLQGSGSTGPGFSIQWTANPGSIVSGANTYTPIVNQPGTYNLVVTSTANGCSSASSVTISGNFDQPLASIAAPGALNCVDTLLTLNAAASSQGPGIQYAWSAQGGGHIVSGNNTASPTIDEPGTYVLTVTNTLSGCTATSSVLVTGNTNAPTANAGPGKVLTCAVTQLTLNGSASTGPFYNYSWTTNNGNIVSGSNTMTPVIDAAGTYTLIVTNTVNGCTAESSVDVSANQTVPQAAATGNPVLNCINTTATLNGIGSSTGAGITYQWIANPGNILSGANGLNNILVNSAGTYTLVVENTANGCTDEASVVVTVDFNAPIAAISPAQLLTCTTSSIQLNAGGSSQGNTISYSWTTTNGNIVSGNGTPAPQINQPGTYQLLVSNTQNGCTATASVTVGQDVTPPVAVVNSAAPITCVTTQVQLNGAGSSAGSQYRYQWSTTNGNITAGQLTLNPSVSQAGTYTLTVTNLDNGCTAQASVTVGSNVALPVANAQAAPSITCATPQVTLNGNGSSQGPQYGYIWTTQNGQILSGANSLQPVVNAAGAYQLIVVNNQSGCTATATVNVAANTAVPLANVAPAGQLSCTTTSLALDGAGSSAGPGFTYAWSTPSGIILSGEGTLNPQIGAVGTYTLLVTNTASGCTASASTTVSADMSIPSASAGPPGQINCQQQQVTLNGSASAQGNPVTFSWTGPGIISGANTLSPLVGQSGWYVLLVTNTANGCTASSGVPVWADLIAPAADAGPAATLNCTQTTLTLDGSISSAGPNFSYQWQASAGGNILSGSNTPSPLINSPGTYTLLVTNTVNGCTAMDAVDVTQDTVAPVASAGAPGLITCANSSVTLNGSGSSGPTFNYEWTTVDGSIQSGGNTLSPIVNAAGTYFLTVFNTVNGCSSSASVEVDKNVDVPIANVQAPNTLTCSTSQVQLNGTGSSTGPGFQYNWTTSGGQILSGANSLNPVVNAPGQYSLTVLNTSNACTAQFTATVTQNLTPPLANAGPPALLSCSTPVATLNGSGSSQGVQYTYQWTTQTGHFLNGTNTLNPQVDHSGIYNLIVTDNQNGCTAVSFVYILLDQGTPQAVAGPDQVLNCISSSVSLLSTGTSTGANFTYQWTASAGGHIVSGANTLSPVVDAPGTYTLLVSNPANGCTAIDATQVSLDQTPPTALIATPEMLNCLVQETMLNTSGSSAGPAMTYQWTTSNGHFISGANGPAPVVSQAGTYQLVLTNSGTGCTAMASVTVLQDIQTPVADAGSYVQLNCALSSAALSGSVANAGAAPQYSWSTPDGNIVSGANTLAPLINAPGTYWLTVTNTLNHCTGTDNVPVFINVTPPLAAAAAGPDLTCTTLVTSLNGSGSSVGSQFSYQWAAQAGGNILSGANTLSPVVDAAGVYSLTVTNSINFCTSTATATIEENTTLPRATANSSSMLNCVTTALNLDGAGSSTGNQFVYEWQSADGNVLSGGNTLSPLINLPGTYVLVVTDLSNGCVDQATVQVGQDVDPPEVAAAAPGPLTCLISTVTLSGAGSSTGNNFSYQWTPVSGQIASGATTLSPEISAPGTYELMVTNSVNGCTSTAEASVIQNIDPPTAIANAADTITCTLNQISLNGFGSGSGQGLSYNWTTTDGLILSGANSPNPLINAGGAYSLLVTDLFNGCTNTATVTVPEDTEAPPVAIAAPPALTCLVNSLSLDATGSAQGSPLVYNWSGPGIVSGSNTLQPTVNQPGVYLLWVINQQNGCTSSASTVVVQDNQPPLAEAGQGFELTCQVADGYLDASASSSSPGITYLWTTTDGNILTGATQTTPLVDAAGLYQLLVTNTSNGCTASDLVQVTENTSHPSGLQYAMTVPNCQGHPGKLRITTVQGGTGPYSYSIDGGNTFYTSNLFDDLGPGDYQIVIRDANGCEYTQPLSLPTPTGLSVALDPEVSLAYGDSTTLVAGLNISPSQIDTIIWSPMQYLTLTNMPNVVHVHPYVTQEYTVTVIDTAGCEDRATVLVRIDDPHLWAPNAISSNVQDGINDVFLIFAAPNTVRNIRKLEIFDRWGDLVFRNENIQPNDEHLGWNGYFRGKPMNPAVFVWWAEVELFSGQSILLKGDVTIVD